jgi:hypothetical protein
VGEKGIAAMRKLRNVVVGFLLVAVALTALSYFIWEYRLRKAVNAELAAIRSAGLPVSTDELDDWYEDVPSGENAAEFFLAAAEAFVRPPVSEDEDAMTVISRVMGRSVSRVIEPSEPLSPEQQAALSEFVRQNGKALDLLHQGAALTRSRYPSDAILGYSAQLPHLAQVRKVTDLLAAEALVAGHEGDGARAVNALRTTVRLADSLAEDIVSPSQGVRLVIHGFSVSTLNRLLCGPLFTDTQMSDLAALLSEAESRDTFARGIAAERCSMVDLMEKLRRDAPNAIPQNLSATLPRRWAWYYGSAFGWYHELELLQAYDALLKAAQAPVDEAFDQQEAAAARLSEASLLPGAAVLFPFPVVLYDPPHPRARHAALLRCARAALAVERYRIAQGDLPETLEVLVPEYLPAVPLDPFGGGPLRYRLLDKCYVVYSVGVDRKDDGGRAERPRFEGVRKGDLPFAVSRP